MTDRYRAPVYLPAIAAVLLLFAVSSAGAQDTSATGQTQAPEKEVSKTVRHIDVEAGVGVHFGLEGDVPIDDDVYAVLGLAAPITEHFDAEAQAAYFSGSENDRLRDPVTDGSPHGSLDGWHFNAGARWYPMSAATAPVRAYLAAGASVLLDYRHSDDETLAANVGPGVRLRAGDHSGFLIRVPVLIMLEGDADPIMVPTFNLFYQF